MLSLKIWFIWLTKYKGSWRKGNTCERGNSSSFSAWRLNYRRERATTSKSNIVGNKAKSFKVWRKYLATERKDKVEISFNHNHDIKSVRCLES
jgi:hypothetical protein